MFYWSLFFIAVCWEFSLLGIFWKFLNEFQEYFSYSVPSHEDIYAAVILVCVNFVSNFLLVCVNFMCNILLVCWINNDYSGKLEIFNIRQLLDFFLPCVRNSDLRWWWWSPGYLSMTSTLLLCYLQALWHSLHWVGIRRL